MCFQVAKRGKAWVGRPSRVSGRSRRKPKGKVAQQLSAAARLRELIRLANRAGCSLEEAAGHRAAGERYCAIHGWFWQRLCIPCKCAREKQRRLDHRLGCE